MVDDDRAVVRAAGGVRVLAAGRRRRRSASALAVALRRGASGRRSAPGGSARSRRSPAGRAPSHAAGRRSPAPARTAAARSALPVRLGRRGRARPSGPGGDDARRARRRRRGGDVRARPEPVARCGSWTQLDREPRRARSRVELQRPDRERRGRSTAGDRRAARDRPRPWRIGQAQATAPRARRGPVRRLRRRRELDRLRADRGRWFDRTRRGRRPDQRLHADRPRIVGDTDRRLDGGGRSVTVRLVGEIFDTADESPDNLVLRGDVGRPRGPRSRRRGRARWEVAARDRRVPRPRLPGLAGAAAGPRRSGVEHARRLEQRRRRSCCSCRSITFMGVVLVAISLGGVFNTVLLETRQRTRELACSRRSA